MTRKSFLKVAGLGAAAVVAGPVISLAGSPKSVKHVGKLRVAPVSGRKYSASFNRLCQGQRFESVKDVLRRVKNRRVEFVVRADGKNFSAANASVPTKRYTARPTPA